MLDMRFDGLPRFVTGFRVASGLPGNDDTWPFAPAALIAAGATTGLRATRRPRSNWRIPGWRRLPTHLTVVK